MNKNLVWVLIALAVLVVLFLVLRGGEPVIDDEIVDVDVPVEEVLDTDLLPEFEAEEEEEEEEVVTPEPVEGEDDTETEEE